MSNNYNDPEFVYKPIRHNGGGLVVVLPYIYTGKIRSVDLVDGSGRVVESGRFRSVANGNRGNWDFSKKGQAYAGLTVRVTDDSGRVVLAVPTGNGNRRTFNVGKDGSSPFTPSGSTGNYQGSSTNQDTELSGSASPSFGGGQLVQGAGGTGVYTPNFIQYDPASLYISYDEAEGRADARADKNVDRFSQNFQLAENFAAETIETELKGLEKFLPRSTDLIRGADAQGNRDILQYSDMFDDRNKRAAYDASRSNVDERAGLVEQYVPGTFSLAQDMVERLKQDAIKAREDEARIRERESTSLLDTVNKDVAARSARNTAADVSAAGGFGIDSALTRNMLDRFDFDKRFELEAANRTDARQGDQAVAMGRQGTQSSEQALMQANMQAQQSFQTLLGPGIRDFTPIQAAPRVTDIGGQVRAMPTTDAGSIRTNFTNQLTPLTTIAPSQAFSSSFEEQKYNRDRDYQWLQYQQQQNDIIASALNESSNLVVSQEQRQEGQALFQEALEQRRRSQDNQGLWTFIAAATPFVGGLIASWVRGGKQPGAQQQQMNQSISDMIIAAGKDGYNYISDFLSSYGLDIGQFDTTGIGGGAAKPPTGATQGTTSNDIWSNNPNTGTGTGTGPSTGTTAPQTGTGANGLSNPDTTSNLNNPNDWNAGVGAGITTGGSGGGTGASSSGDFTNKTRAKSATQTAKNAEVRDLGGGLTATVGTNGTVTYGIAEGVTATPEQTTAVNDLNNYQAQFVAAQNNPAKAPELLDTLRSYGLDTRVATGIVDLWTNWDNYSESDRVFQMASILNTIGDNLQLYDAAGPIGGIISAIRQSVNLYNNWDNMSDGERAQAGVQISGTLAASYVTYTMAAGGASGAATGGIGLAIAFGVMAVARSTRILIDEGFSGSTAIAAVVNPLQSFWQAIDDSLWNIGIHNLSGSQNDADNIALLGVPGIGTGLALHNMLGGDMDWTSGKSQEEKLRDSLRNIGEDPKYGAFLYKENGVHQLDLADGSTFAIGKGGSNKLDNVGTNIDGKNQRHYFDVDWSNPIINDVVGIADPLSVLLFRNAKGNTMVGYLTNALTAKDPTNLDNVKANAKDLALRAGLDYNTGVQLLGAMRDNKSLPEEKYNAYIASWRKLMLG